MRSPFLFPTSMLALSRIAAQKIASPAAEYATVIPCHINDPPALFEANHISSFEVHITSLGGVPLRWDIIDSLSAGNGGSEDRQQAIKLIGSHFKLLPLRMAGV